MKSFIKTRLTFALTISAFQFLSVSAFSQGSLTPPGPPAPMMKTLGQIEPRTPISSLPYSITSPGSYYLTTNLTGSASNYGITVQADNVTIDLNGFTLVGVTNSYDAIALFSPRKNVTIRNGIITGWSRNGIDASGGSNCRFESLIITGNGTTNVSFDGIHAGSGAVVFNCVANGNVGSGAGFNGNAGCTFTHCSSIGNLTGFSVTNCTIHDCTAQGNAGFGFNLSDGCTLTNSTSQGNTGTGGIGVVSQGFGGSLIVDCNVRNNAGGGISSFNDAIIGCGVFGNSNFGIRNTSGRCLVDRCAVTDTANGPGIIAGDGSMIESSNIQNNRGDGIRASYNAYILNNNVSENGTSSASAGIHITGDGGRIEGNACSDNSFDGIWLDDGSNGTHNTVNNFVIKNIARGNGGFNYRIAGLTTSGLTGTNEVAPLQVPMNATNPEANSQ